MTTMRSCAYILPTQVTVRASVWIIWYLYLPHKFLDADRSYLVDNIKYMLNCQMSTLCVCPCTWVGFFWSSSSLFFSSDPHHLGTIWHPAPSSSVHFPINFFFFWFLCSLSLSATIFCCCQFRSLQPPPDFNSLLWMCVCVCVCGMP